MLLRPPLKKSHGNTIAPTLHCQTPFPELLILFLGEGQNYYYHYHYRYRYRYRYRYHYHRQSKRFCKKCLVFRCPAG